MSNIADRITETIEKNKEAHSMMPRRPLRVNDAHENTTVPFEAEETQNVSNEQQIIPASVSEYSSRSQIAKAYRVGEMPFAHAQLFRAIKKVLNGESEGEIVLQEALDISGIPRRSALNILKHMANFGVLVSEPRFRCTWVKISPEWFSR